MVNSPSDRELIEAGQWVPCRICERVFLRRRETKRYCNHCGIAVCEGEHAGVLFVGQRFILCVTCIRKQQGW